jgi:hypothetical protein
VVATGIAIATDASSLRVVNASKRYVAQDGREVHALDGIGLTIGA